MGSRVNMKTVKKLELEANQAALWFLGQAGYLLRAAGVTVAIDLYLSDSVQTILPEFGRLLPVPLEPEDLAVDLYLVTHAHSDHLDPETIRRYRHKENTRFVAPRLAARRLIDLGVPPVCVARLDAGEQLSCRNVSITGVFALPTGADVLDTTGYLLTFENGRSVYHTSDTAFTPLLLQAAPKDVEVLLLPINGKWGNLTVEQAVELTAFVKPRYVLPNHYDMMALNAENPQTFRWLCRQRQVATHCVIPTIMEPFVWA
jgi:L-ascorbate 6-phosphate lactonase